MPKDLKVEPKKKMVVVEEVTDTPEEIETPKKENIDTPTVSEAESLDNAAPDVAKVESLDMPLEDQDDKPNYLWIIIPTALLIGALVGGLITYFSGLSKINVASPSSTPQPTLIPEATPVPSSTPSTNVKKDELKVQILNGSGVSGAAGKAKMLLEAAGYKNVDTGNASVSNLAQTEIQIKSTKAEFLDLLIKDLEKSYSAVEAEKPLVTTSKFDVVITLGKK